MTQPPQPVPPRRELNPALLILGVVLGVLGCWVWITVMLFSSFAIAYDDDGSDPAAIALLALAGAPVVAAIVLLAVRRTRQLGAGIIMGIAIGAIGGSGVCASILGQGLVG